MNRYTLTLQQIVKNNNIFDFDYPVHREDFRGEFEQLFIDYFLFEEIAHETVAQFKHRLKTKLNLIMPYYNKIYMTLEMQLNILESVDVVETYTKEMKGESKSTSKNLFKDAPKTKIDIEKFDTVTNLSKDESNSIIEGSTVNSSDGFSSNNEKWERRMTGNIGVQTDSDAIVKYWSSLRKVEQEIFDELECLFMGVY